MADQTQSPASQQSVAVTGLTYPVVLAESPYQQDAPKLNLSAVGASVLISGLSFPVVIGEEVSYQKAPVLQLQVPGESVTFSLCSGGGGGEGGVGEGGFALPTTGQIWPSGLIR